MMYGMAVDLHILAPVLKSLVLKWNNVPTTAFLKVDQNLMWEWGGIGTHVTVLVTPILFTVQF